MTTTMIPRNNNREETTSGGGSSPVRVETGPESSKVFDPGGSTIRLIVKNSNNDDENTNNDHRRMTAATATTKARTTSATETGVEQQQLQCASRKRGSLRPPGMSDRGEKLTLESLGQGVTPEVKTAASAKEMNATKFSGQRIKDRGFGADGMGVPTTMEVMMTAAKMAIAPTIPATSLVRGVPATESQVDRGKFPRQRTHIMENSYHPTATTRTTEAKFTSSILAVSARKSEEERWRTTITSRRTITARTEPTTIARSTLLAAKTAATTTSSKVIKKQNKAMDVKQRAECDGTLPPGQGDSPEVKKRAGETIVALKFVPDGQTIFKFVAWRMEGGAGVQPPRAPGQINPNLNGGTNGGQRVLKLDDCCKQTERCDEKQFPGKGDFLEAKNCAGAPKVVRACGIVSLKFYRGSKNEGQLVLKLFERQMKRGVNEGQIVSELNNCYAKRFCFGDESSVCGSFSEVKKRAEEAIGVLKFIPEGQSFLKFVAWRMEGGDGVQPPHGAPEQSKNPPSLEKFASKIKRFITPNLYGGTNGGRRVLKLDDSCAKQTKGCDKNFPGKGDFREEENRAGVPKPVLACGILHKFYRGEKNECQLVLQLFKWRMQRGVNGGQIILELNDCYAKRFCFGDESVCGSFGFVFRDMKKSGEGQVQVELEDGNEWEGKPHVEAHRPILQQVATQAAQGGKAGEQTTAKPGEVPDEAMFKSAELETSEVAGIGKPHNLYAMDTGTSTKEAGGKA